jgi:hypothetical protein
VAERQEIQALFFSPISGAIWHLIPLIVTFGVGCDRQGVDDAGKTRFSRGLRAGEA